MKFAALPAPHIVLYADTLPNGFKGTARGPIVSIRNDAKGDKPILIHEQRHVAQFWCLSLVAAAAIAVAAYLTSPMLYAGIPLAFGVHSALYLWVPAYRCRAEVSAYAAQVQQYPADQQPQKAEAYAEFVSTRYGLKVSKAAALARILKAAS